MTNNNINTDFISEGTRNIFAMLENQNFIKKYTLVGGTALALQIGHRMSEDLDFIYDGDKLNTTTIKRNMAKVFPGYKIIRQEDDWHIDFIVQNIKVTFFSSGAIVVPFNIIEHSFQHQNINICPAKIIASLKMAAIAQRNTIRDYYDLYFIARYNFPLKEIIEQTQQLIPGLSPVTYTETLVYTDDIDENSIREHLNPKEQITKTEIAHWFVEELKRIIT